MIDPRVFRDKLLTYFEKTKKKVWSREEVAKKVFDLWWDVPKKIAPVPKKRLRKTKAGRAVPLKPTGSLGQTIPDEGSDTPELAGDS